MQTLNPRKSKIESTMQTTGRMNGMRFALPEPYTAG